MLRMIFAMFCEFKINSPLWSLYKPVCGIAPCSTPVAYEPSGRNSFSVILYFFLRSEASFSIANNLFSSYGIPFVLKSFNDLSESKLKDSIWNKPFYYLENNINSKVELMNFKINDIQFKVSSSDTNSLTLAQNPYPGWHTYVNDVETASYQSNISHQSVKINKGESIVRWKYSNNTLIILFILHLLILLALLIYYFRLYIQFINLHKIK